MINSGFVSLQDESGTIITCKKYNSKKNRNLIIETWRCLYAIDKKPITINIIPYLDEFQPIGIIEIYIRNVLFETLDYYSQEERDTIINDWKNKYKNFYIHIKPTQ